MNELLLWKPDSLLEPGIVDIAHAIADAGLHFRQMQSALSGRLIVLDHNHRFGECLKLYREQAIGMTLRQFSKWVEMSSTTQSRLEDSDGERSPSAGYLMRLRMIELKRQTALVKLSRRAGEPHKTNIMRIDRATSFGNPYGHGAAGAKMASEFRCETREQCVRAFMEWILAPERQWYLDHLSGFLGRTLGCWCVPELCHGHVVIALVRNMPWSGKLLGRDINPTKLWEEVQTAAKVSWTVGMLKSEGSVWR